MSKEIKISHHGNYLFGNLDGVDYVTKGTYEGNEYPASIKLKFVMRVLKVKSINGVEVPTKVAITQTIKIPTTDDNLALLVAKYNELLGQDLLINYATGANDTFVVKDEKDILTIK
jgi:hypothetical protein